MKVHFFNQAVERVSGLACVGRLIVVTGASQAETAVKQLGAMGQDADILIEPEGRNSAAALAVAAVHIAAIEKDGILVALPADHFIPDTPAFQREIDHAVLAAGRGSIITLGIQPRAQARDMGIFNPASAMMVFQRSSGSLKSQAERWRWT